LGPYEIRFLVPASDRDPGAEPRYRIKSGSELYERVAPESELLPLPSTLA